MTETNNKKLNANLNLLLSAYTYLWNLPQVCLPIILCLVNVVHPWILPLEFQFEKYKWSSNIGHRPPWIHSHPQLQTASNYLIILSVFFLSRKSSFVFASCIQEHCASFLTVAIGILTVPEIAIRSATAPLKCVIPAFLSRGHRVEDSSLPWVSV